MKHKTLILALLVVLLASSITFAEDGNLFRRNISKTPDLVTEKAAIYMMDFYVPAQASTGELLPVDNYYLESDTCEPQTGEGCESAYEARDYAKPLVTVYIDGPEGLDLETMAAGSTTPGAAEITGGVIFGAMDAFVATSLDDGTTWRNENLSRSADLSSFTLGNGHAFPGHVHQLVHQVAEDKIFVAWASKYCDNGNPLYTFTSDTNYSAYGPYLESLEGEPYSKDALYLYDFFGVAGTQGSVDYTLQGFPEVGEIPYSCIWTARGKLVAGDDPLTDDFVEASHVLWAKPERLTSGTRDANLPAVDCAGGAGCVITWQEDPLGLRPGQGLGPGEGWSGAIANGKTDIWYSYISFADFDLVFPEGTDYTNLPADGPVSMEVNEADQVAAGGDISLPKPYVPMAMPSRLTDNEMCKGANEPDPYCWFNFDNIDTVNWANLQETFEGLTEPQENATFCAETVPWTNPGGTTHELCITRDGRVLIGRVGATRVRMVLKPYTQADGTTSAWLSLAAEETKAMGDTLVDPYGNVTDDPLDMGKDVWYYTFDMFEHPVVDQGGILNQPSMCNPYLEGSTYECTPGEFLPIQMATVDTKDGDGNVTGSYEIGEFYLTDIARRFALTLNGISNIALPTDGGSGLSGVLIYKQGGIWQGGPADIMLRRLVVPDDFDPTVDNPFAFENMACDEWAYTDGSNPNYLKGLCLSPAINLSASTIKRCTTRTGGELADNNLCADEFPVAEDGSVPDDVTFENFPKVLEWRQLPYEASSAEDDFTGDDNDSNDLDDQWWENPFDVAKGHRGFLDGDYVMMMYAWSPNWNANTVGNDHYNLYVRRSFDGGLTWTTTPAALGGAGLEALEYQYGENAGDFVPIVWSYGAGAAEQARDVSLLHGNKITILDPRYSPSGGLKQYPTIKTDWVTDPAHTELFPADWASDDVLPYEDDLARDISKFVMIYETGDNTTVDVGEAIPLDLYYSRATVYGDIWEWYDYVNDPIDYCDPEAETCNLVELEPRWPWLENAADDLSGEASVVLNPGGTFSYQVWNQWKEEILPDGHELIYDSDMIFRRLMYVPDDYEWPPIATLLYQSDTTLSRQQGDVLIAIGTARDLDNLGEGIVEYQWRSNIDGVLTSEKMLVIPASDLSLGRHTISFTALDGEGNWASPVSATLLVTEQPNQIYLPLVSQH